MGQSEPYQQHRDSNEYARDAKAIFEVLSGLKKGQEDGRSQCAQGNVELEKRIAERLDRQDQLLRVEMNNIVKRIDLSDTKIETVKDSVTYWRGWFAAWAAVTTIGVPLLCFFLAKLWR